MNSKLIGDAKPSPEAIQQMREHIEPGQKFATYQNMALDSASVGELRFLKIGKGCTFTEAPARYPDTQFGTGWRHLHCGFVDLETGEIVD